MNNAYGTCFFISLNQERPVRQGRSFLAVSCRVIDFTSYYSSVRVKYCISYGSPSSVYPKLLYRHKPCMGNSPFRHLPRRRTDSPMPAASIFISPHPPVKSRRLQS